MKSFNEFILPKKVLKRISYDPVKSAEAINLEHVADHLKGIIRKRKGKNFQYFLDNKPVNDEKTLSRIKKLVIPPAWENVWICPTEQGHLQATGIDKLKRKQYRYHNLWSKLRNETKFYRMYEFGKTLPLIREQLKKDLARHGMPLEKVLAALVLIMEKTHIRIGNSFYEKLYGSYGLTTLKEDHVEVSGSTTKFTFKGKKGVEHSIDLNSKRLSRMVQKFIDVPGKELFQYYDKERNNHCIDSGMVNRYIKQISGKNFSSKDFRTWEGTANALLAIKEINAIRADQSIKRNEVEILNMVAACLGNTRIVCKKYYVHPAVLELYEADAIDKYLKTWDKPAIPENTTGLLPVEKVLMKILELK